MGGLPSFHVNGPLDLVYEAGIGSLPLSPLWKYRIYEQYQLEGCILCGLCHYDFQYGFPCGINMECTCILHCTWDISNIHKAIMWNLILRTPTLSVTCYRGQFSLLQLKAHTFYLTLAHLGGLSE